MNKDKIPDGEQSEYSWAKKFIEENELMFRNGLLQSFLHTKENWFLLDQSIRYSTSDAKRALDMAFREHLAEIRLISQLSNDLRRFAIRFDQKLNRDRQRQLLILDKPIHDEEHTSISRVDLIADCHARTVDQAVIENESLLEDKIENPALYNAIRSLTPRQKYILEASYLFNMTDTEIAARDGVSQQSISKTRNKALANIKKQLLEEEDSYD
ncbi:sigma-70 family RNA polymerase sigma factor [Oceanobacillus massiliensis]|uniref:sigma-70 family RNA polymerase sigma factor n=1 Tax=Oceanobacillus massiliensis TaxID=1465765 RepID=UPI000289CF88|nr:sigma-70 family RNA polymerase sigma factor [Oceanobacillus massiliensis]